MAKANTNRLSGPYMVQDSDHMAETGQQAKVEQPKQARQSQQSDSEGRQQGGGDQNESRQQGGERRRR